MLVAASYSRSLEIINIPDYEKQLYFLGEKKKKKPTMTTKPTSETVKRKTNPTKLIECLQRLMSFLSTAFSLKQKYSSSRI